MTRSFWLSVLAYLLPTFVLGYVWHLVLFADRYARLERTAPTSSSRSASRRC